jgi:hypothetical protein
MEGRVWCGKYGREGAKGMKGIKERKNGTTIGMRGRKRKIKEGPIEMKET